LIPNTKDRSLTTSGVKTSGSFGISIDDSAHIMTILRDTLYSDKIMAVLREYSANAWDAQKEAGRGNEPIEVVLPTHAKPTLQIKDKGPGLSSEGIFKVFAQYGASTKRDSDSAVGMMGIGSKSGFAYSDSFTVISSHGGVKRTYVAVLDESDKGVINLLHEEPCGESTGVTIEIAVKSSDIGEFYEKAKRLFAFFFPQPKINISIPALKMDTLSESEHGAIVSCSNGGYYTGKELQLDKGAWVFTRGTWIARMGCIGYPIDLAQLGGFGSSVGIPSFLSSMGGVLNFNIGELQISASRESLKYGESTKKALIEKFEKLIEEFVTKTIDAASKTSTSAWERLVRCRILAEMNLPVPVGWKQYVMQRVPLKDTPLTFEITRMKIAERDVDLSQENRLLLRDDHRSLKGFTLNRWDYIVVRKDSKTPWGDVRKELDDLLAKSGLTGIPISTTSSLTWQKPVSTRRSNGPVVNEKHRLKTFTLVGRGGWRHPKSRNWEAAEVPPKPSSPFVIIKEFEVWQYGHFREELNILQTLSIITGREVPTIYGFKTTEKNPVTYSTPGLGIPMEEWVKKAVRADIKDPRTLAHLDEADWEHHAGIGRGFGTNEKSVMMKFINRLNQDNILRKYLEDSVAAPKVRKDVDEYRIKSLYDYVTASKLWESKVLPRRRAIRVKYPLLAMMSNLHSLWTGGFSDQWLDYFNLIDEKFRKEIKNGSSSVHTDEGIDNSHLGGKVAHSEEGSSQLPATA